MITRRTIINMITFLTAAVALVVLGVVNLLGNPFRGRTQVSAIFPDASGLHQHFSVTYNGVDVGQVSAVKFAPTGVRVVMSFDPGVVVPSDVVASVDLANALGEQQVDLKPTRGGTAPPLRDGAVVPVDPNGVPASVGKLVAVATRLLDAVPPDDLNTVLHEMAVALNGRGQDMRTITDASRQFADEFLRYQDQFKSLLANSPPVLDSVSAVGPELRQALTNTAVLTQVLADRRFDMSTALVNGAEAGGDLQSLVGSQLPNLACLIHDFADLNANLGSGANLANLDTSLRTNEWFFGAVDAVAPQGPAKSLWPGDPAHSQYWLRTRLFLPPKQPPAQSYAQVRDLPATKPGAACNTEFGSGAPAAAQANPSPPGPGGRVVPPTAAESQVRGGASPAAQPAAYRAPVTAAPTGSGSAVPLALGATVLLGIMLAGRLATPADPAARRPPGRAWWRR
ncbi:MAG TPA: MCE family protein [Acidimicrobiales bacterium]|nr:MCE family protein [Acidimicrobiales bacterium]